MDGIRLKKIESLLTEDLSEMFRQVYQGKHARGDDKRIEGKRYSRSGCRTRTA